MISIDIPNAFIQAPVEYKPGDELIIMKMTGAAVEILLLIDPVKYQGYVVYKNGKKVIYLKVLRAIYGMLMSAAIGKGLKQEEVKDFSQQSAKNSLRTLRTLDN